MKNLAVFQSKISKTKKKLSDDRWLLSINVLAVIALMIVLVFAIKSISRPETYGFVEATIPVLHVPIEDASFNTFEPTPQKQISKTTTAVILADNGDFYFGDLDAFGPGFYLTRNKFVVPALQGAPHVFNLLDTIEKWIDQRARQDRIKNDKILVFSPQSSVPINIIIQIMAQFRRSDLFDDIILANGFR